MPRPSRLLTSRVGDVALRPEEGVAGDDDDFLVVRAGGVGREECVEFFGAVRADDGKTPVTEFEQVRAGFAIHTPSLPRGIAESADNTDAREFGAHGDPVPGPGTRRARPSDET